MVQLLAENRPLQKKKKTPVAGGGGGFISLVCTGLRLRGGRKQPKFTEKLC